MRFIKLSLGTLVDIDDISVIAHADLNKYFLLFRALPGVQIIADGNEVETIEKALGDIIKVEKKPEVLKTKLEIADD